MAGICTSSVSPSGCGHRTITVVLDGVPVTIETHEADTLEPLTLAELEVFVKLGARRLRQKGVTLAAFLNRVLVGDEATNVKQYDFLGPGSTVTKTNIGAAYVNVLPGLNGERILVDCTGCTEFRVVLTANFVGVGAFGARIVRDSDNTVLFENANLVQTGERELDTNWQPLPAWSLGLEILRLQAKSVTAADDPVFRRCLMLVR